MSQAWILGAAILLAGLGLTGTLFVSPNANDSILPTLSFLVAIGLLLAIRKPASDPALLQRLSDQDKTLTLLQQHHTTLENILLQRTRELSEARDKALRASEAKSRFLATMSHELRTPLNAVLGMLELLEKSDLPAEQREFVEVARGSGVSLLATINDVLDFSKIEAGKFLLDTLDIDLRSLVEGVTKSMAPLAHSKGIEVTAYIPHEFPTHVRGDPNRLRQIFTNLLGNAIKFTPRGGLVELHGGVTGQDGENLEFLFEVRDTGQGIPDTYRESVFDFFTQVDDSTSRQHGGTGLGLAICKRLVELMGGEIGVEANPFAQSGSIFHFTVQLRQQEERRPNPDRIMFSGSRVLVAGSSGIQLDLIQNCLNAWGAKHGALTDWRSLPDELAQARSQDRPYDLVILNHPTEDHGPEVEALVHALDPPTPTILLTHFLPEGRRECPPDDLRLRCVKKPIDVAGLYEAIHDLLDALEHGKPAPAQSVPAQVWTDDTRVLVVDDNEANLRLARGMLKALGCLPENIVLAAGGPEAITHCQERPFHLILMDCQMPGMDGYETTRILRRNELAQGERRASILAFTADVTKGARTSWRGAGMDDYLAKPVTLSTLQEAMRRHLTPEQRGDTPTATPVRPREVDLEAAMAGFGCSPEEFLPVAEVILEDVPRLAATLERALAEGDRDLARSVSHTLKGSLVNTLFPQLAPFTRALHERVRLESWSEAGNHLLLFRHEFALVEKALHFFCETARIRN